MSVLSVTQATQIIQIIVENLEEHRLLEFNPDRPSELLRVVFSAISKRNRVAEDDILRTSAYVVEVLKTLKSSGYIADATKFQRKQLAIAVFNDLCDEGLDFKSSNLEDLRQTRTWVEAMA